MTGRAIAGLAALILAGCGAGVSVNPGGGAHPDAAIEVLSVNSEDGGADSRADEASDDSGHLARDALVTDGETEAAPSPDAGTIALVQFAEFGISTPNAHPQGIALGPDGNIWFTEGGSQRVGRISSTGVIKEFYIERSCDRICAGPDGNLWFSELSDGRIARMSISGNVSDFDLSGAAVGGITAGPDGNIWFAEATKIGRMTPPGKDFTEFAVPGSDGATGIVSGSDGNLWVSDLHLGRIYRVTTDGVVTAVDTPTPRSGPIGIAWNSATGRLWFTEGAVDKIGTLDPERVDSDPTTAITEFPTPVSGGGVLGLTVSPDGTVWFTEFYGNRIGTVTAEGTFTEFVIPTGDSGPADIVADSAGNLWFTEENANSIGRLSVAR